MTEYKVGDKVTYKGVKGTIVREINGLYEVRLNIEEGRYLYAYEMESLTKYKGCSFCKHSEPLNDTSNSNFALVIKQGESAYYLESEYDPGEWNDNDWGNINYCPMCGRKLEVAE